MAEHFTLEKIEFFCNYLEFGMHNMLYEARMNLKATRLVEKFDTIIYFERKGGIRYPTSKRWWYSEKLRFQIITHFYFGPRSFRVGSLFRDFGF